jgi:hypothetical protein
MKIQNLESLAGLKQNQLLSFCNKQRDKSIVLMPAGVASQNVTKYLQYHNIDIAYFVDNNPHKQNTSLLTKKIVSFESFLEDNNAVLLIASNLCFSEQIEKQCLVSKLTDYHIVKEDYVCFSPYEIDNAFELIKQKFPAYLAVYDLFEDELSRLTFLNRLKYLITYNPEYLAEIARPLVNQYFESDIYRVSEKDCFVDCGAYTGDTLTALLSFTGGRLAGYYGFEPDIKNYTALKQKTELVRGGGGGGCLIVKAGCF